VLDRLRAFLVVALPLLLGSAALGGAWLGARGLAPLAAMAARAREISASRFDLRLPVDGVGELRRTAEGVNDLLDRLQDAFARQRRFIADASHELRTPTAILRSEAEVTLARPHRDEASYRDALAVVRDAAQRLDRVVDDLFLLARADAEPGGAAREPLYLEEVVHDTVRAVQPLGARRGVRVQVAALAPAVVLGDADLVGRVLLNLLDNAVKHAPEGSAVTVTMSCAGRTATVAVHDTGPGIPVEARERIFERFWRVDAARGSGALPGAGLGLAIARRIAEVHGGELVLVDGRPGATTFALRLPTMADGDERGPASEVGSRAHKPSVAAPVG
jgi:heavy metal sensor kinase